MKSKNVRLDRSQPDILINQSDLTILYRATIKVDITTLFGVASQSFEAYFRTRKGKYLLKHIFGKNAESNLRFKLMPAANSSKHLFSDPSYTVLPICNFGTHHPGLIGACVNSSGDLMFYLATYSHEAEIWYAQPLIYANPLIMANGLVIALVKQLQSPKAVAKLFEQLEISCS